MKTLKKVVVSFKEVGLIPDKAEMEENVLYVSYCYSTIVHKCLCGCGELTVTPTNSGGWKFTIEKEKISLTPSIGNFNYACKSHYIITNNVANFV